MLNLNFSDFSLHIVEDVNNKQVLLDSMYLRLCDNIKAPGEEQKRQNVIMILPESERVQS